MLAAVSVTHAQTQAPMVVVPAAAAPATAKQTAAVAPVDAGTYSVEASLKALQQLKAANDELLQKQAATLQQLEDAEKAAEQMKIYSKRG